MGFVTGDFDATHGHRMPMWANDYGWVKRVRRGSGRVKVDWHPEGALPTGTNRRDHRRHAMRFSRAKASGS